MKKAGIYCRVSTANEEDKASLAAQEAACRQYLEAAGDYEVVEVISDVEAVENPDRAGISKLISMLGDKQLNAICIDTRARLGSDAEVAALLIKDWEELGAEVLFVQVTEVAEVADDDGEGTKPASAHKITSPEA